MQILNCSKRVIDFHATNMQRKFNVTSRPQLIAKALRRKLISLAMFPLNVETQ
ncbi:LuxR C-terminal-related transcriptional regulator [Desulfobacter curvatus]|uniref:LuxR C-terminal-related transcriptional regulator n=1 Tax=Desulfobacter curvatus TaxID=2290 RepID=UPI000A02F656